MRARRLLRLPILLEEAALAIIVGGVLWSVNFLWTNSTVWSERALTVIGAGIAVGFLSFAYAKYRNEDIVVVSNLEQYNKQLDVLARRHRGTVRWVTKTSIWADEKGGSHSGRLKEKLEGIRRGRIKEMRYILHLSYWRDSVERERAKPNAGSRAALQYRRKLMNLLSNLEDFASCPPEKVLVIPGEIEDPAPPHRFGLYQRGRRSLLIFGYDAPGRETLPRLFVRSHPELLRYFENQFTEQWEKYLDHIESHLDKGRGYTRGVREYVIEVLREELAWVESRIDASALRQRSGEQKTIVAPAGPPHTP